MEMVDGDGVYLPQVFLDPLNKKNVTNISKNPILVKALKGPTCFKGEKCMTNDHGLPVFIGVKIQKVKKNLAISIETYNQFLQICGILGYF